MKIRVLCPDGLPKSFSQSRAAEELGPFYVLPEKIYPYQERKALENSSDISLLFALTTNNFLPPLLLSHMAKVLEEGWAFRRHFALEGKTLSLIVFTPQLATKQEGPILPLLQSARILKMKIEKTIFLAQNNRGSDSPRYSNS